MCPPHLMEKNVIVLFMLHYEPLLCIEADFVHDFLVQEFLRFIFQGLLVGEHDGGVVDHHVARGEREDAVLDADDSLAIRLGNRF